jgi:acetate kinase
MGLLVLNLGSATLKVALFAADPAQPDTPPQRLWEASTPRSGELTPQLESWLALQLQPWWPQIHVAGHRLVHGGEWFVAPTRLNAAVLQELEGLNPMAPLHNPPALEAIQWLQALRPSLPQWACFDTAFHSTLPPEASTYALPAAWRQRGYRRYGFHGINHQHVAEALPCARLISAHLGAGCSLAAVHHGRSIDTTMGFTPLEGLVMASRSGSVDPGLLLHLQRQGLSLGELEQGLQQRSGLLGLSELSGDWRQLRLASADGHRGAQLAVAVFLHRLRAGIGAMAASLGGVDQIALSGGIGANDPSMLNELKQSMAWLGAVRWTPIPADEEGMIARVILQQDRLSRADRGSDAAGG